MLVQPADDKFQVGPEAKEKARKEHLFRLPGLTKVYEPSDFSSSLVGPDLIFSCKADITGSMSVYCWKCGATASAFWWDEDYGALACRLCGARQGKRWLPQPVHLGQLSRGRPSGGRLLVEYAVLTS